MPTARRAARSVRGSHAPGRIDLAAASKMDEPVFVDSHVHYYSCFDKSNLITSAIGNFESAAAELGRTESPVGTLIFVENPGSRDLSRFADEVQRDKADPWEIAATSERSSLTVLRNGVRRLVLLAGRQIRTSESLEVLAIDCAEDIPDGRPIRETLRLVYNTGAIGVVPWAFGKWWFGRGRLVNALIEEETSEHFFLGDNGGRPYRSPRPEQFRRAQERGIRVLPGTDPLPWPGEETRIGSYGFWVCGSMDYDRPGESLKLLLNNPKAPPMPYGRGPGWLPCLHKQWLIRSASRPA
jgi:hypothetical protein